MCNHKARRGEGRQTESKNILRLALIVSASVLLLLSPRQAENTTENTHPEFPLAPFPLINLPSQWLIAGADLGLVTPVATSLLTVQVRFNPTQVFFFSLLDNTASLPVRRQLIITLTHYSDYYYHKAWWGEEGQQEQCVGLTNETRPTGCGTWPCHYTCTSGF